MSVDWTVEDLQEARARSIAERAAEEEDFPEATDPSLETDEGGDPEELFVLEQGRKVTISQLVRRGTPVEYHMNLNSKSFPGGGDMGLLPYSDPYVVLVVPARQGKVVHDPTYNSDTGELEKVVIRVNFRPLSAHASSSPEGRGLVGL